MKTKIESQESKKVQHVTLAMAFISVSLLIMSVTANAQETMKSYYASNEADYTAFLMNEARPGSVKETSFNATASFAALLEIESENALEIEEWMMNENNFGTFISLEAETDEPLELEEWMTDEDRFYAMFQIVEEAEDELKVENWMLNSNLF